MKGIPRLHAQLGPAILGLSTDGSTGEQLELQLGALLLDHIGQSQDFGGDTHTRAQHQTAVLGDGRSLHNGNIQLAGVGGVVLGEEAPSEVLSEGGQVNIAHLDFARVDSP